VAPRQEPASTGVAPLLELGEPLELAAPLPLPPLLVPPPEPEPEPDEEAPCEPEELVVAPLEDWVISGPPSLFAPSPPLEPLHATATPPTRAAGPQKRHPIRRPPSRCSTMTRMIRSSFV
jgi:hypothetical protein